MSKFEEYLSEEKSLKKSDVKATERKIDQDTLDIMGNNEISFLNTFIKKGEKIDGKLVKSVDSIIKKYKAAVGVNKINNDANLMLLAPILASMMIKIKHD